MIHIDQATYTFDGELINRNLEGISQWETIGHAVRWRIALANHGRIPYIVTDVNQVAVIDIIGYLNVYTYTEEMESE